MFYVLPVKVYILMKLMFLYLTLGWVAVSFFFFKYIYTYKRTNTARSPFTRSSAQHNIILLEIGCFIKGSHEGKDSQKSSGREEESEGLDKSYGLEQHLI